MTRARTDSGAGTGWASSCFDAGYITRVVHGRRRTGGLTWSHPADRVVVDDYLLAIDQLEARLLELDAQ